MIPFFLAILGLLLLVLLLLAFDKWCRVGGPLLALTGVLVAEVWRRRLLPVSGVILIIGQVFLPVILGVSPADEDGLRTLLEYGQGWIALVLLLVTMMMSCASLSDERETGRLGFMSLRPGMELRWLPGKWAGVIGAVLVMLIPATTVLYLQVSLGSPEAGNRRAKSPITALQFEVTEEDIDSFLSFKREESPLDWGLQSPEENQRRAKMYLERQARSISNGGKSYLDFDLPPTQEKSVQLSLRPAMGKAHRSRVARLGVKVGDYSQDLLVTNGKRVTVDIPLKESGSNQLQVELNFSGAVAEEVNIPAIYWIDDDSVQLKVTRGSFFGSLARSQALLLIRCAFIAALSLCVSTFLGFPVAILFGVCFLIAASGGGFAGAFEDEGASVMVDPRQETTARYLIDRLAAAGGQIVSGLLAWANSNTSEIVSAGEFVSWARLGRGLFIIGGLWSGLALVAGILVIRRTEHATGDNR
ncbi:MAG: hypothetical protein GWP41_01215 [Planctomycetia bacterium]|nr:hypothetical protein [Planctomycetia bacterium]